MSSFLFILAMQIPVWILSFHLLCHDFHGGAFMSVLLIDKFATSDFLWNGMQASNLIYHQSAAC